MADTTRLSQLVTEVISTGAPKTRVSQLVAEVINTGSPKVLVSQLVVEVIISNQVISPAISSGRMSLGVLKIGIGI